jgi:hypothetical protein
MVGPSATATASSPAPWIVPATSKSRPVQSISDEGRIDHPANHRNKKGPENHGGPVDIAPALIVPPKIRAATTIPFLASFGQEEPILYAAASLEYVGIL